jgi:hypothetical protein
VIVVTYGSSRLKTSCQSAEAAEQEFGQAYASAVRSMIADIEAFDTASDLLQFYGSAAAIEVDDSLTLEIGANCSARFVLVGERVQRDGEGRVVWASVQRLKLIAIVRC